jgi:hypothetical protein
VTPFANFAGVEAVAPAGLAAPAELEPVPAGALAEAPGLAVLGALEAFAALGLSDFGLSDLGLSDLAFSDFGLDGFAAAGFSAAGFDALGAAALGVDTLGTDALGVTDGIFWAKLKAGRASHAASVKTIECNLILFLISFDSRFSVPGFSSAVLTPAAAKFDRADYRHCHALRRGLFTKINRGEHVQAVRQGDSHWHRQNQVSGGIFLHEADVVV